MRDENTNSDYEYYNYLSRKHSSISASSSVVENVVKKATGKKVENKSRIITGEVNEVYSIQIENQNLIVRISRSEENRFIPEKWAIDKSREAGVPVSEILLIDEAEEEDKKMWVQVETKLSGRLLCTVDDLSDENMRTLYEKAGELLARIHSITTKGYGRLKKEGVGDYDSWQTFMLHSLNSDEIKNIYDSAKRMDVPSCMIDLAFKIISDNCELYKGVSPHLLHGDYDPQNILVEGDRITGIIDYENCNSGDIAYDYSWWSYFIKNRPIVNCLINGYKKIAKLPSDFVRQVVIGRIRLGLDMICYYDKIGLSIGKEIVKVNLEKDLNYFT